MFSVLRRLSAAKISYLILKGIFYYSKFLGISNFHLKTTTEGKLRIEDLNPKWKWFHAVHSLEMIIIFSLLYVYWVLYSNDWMDINLHILRLILSILCRLCILRLQLCKGQELLQLMNGFLQIFERIRNIRHPKRIGFGGKQELIMLSVMVVGLIHENVFLIRIFQIEKNTIFLISWITDSYISIGNQLLINFVFMWYLTLGLQFSDLNDFVRTQLRYQLDALEAKPNRKRLRKAHMTLDKCLTLYKDLLALTSRFQRIYDLIFLLSLIQNCVNLAVFSYKIVVDLQFDRIWVWSETVIRIVNMLLICLSVHRAMLQFRTIRVLMLENSYLSEIKDWHRTVDMFLTHLSLHELRVCPLGLLTISNELILVFLSALINYFTVVIQYGMQQKVVSNTIKQLSFENAERNL